MADLLSPEQRALIASAIKDVADTFFKTTVVVYVQTGEFDRFAEGRSKTFQSYSLKALAEYPGYQTEDSINRFGQLTDRQVLCTFNYADMKAANITQGISGTKIKEETDYMVIDGTRYDIIASAPDGPIDAENLLFVVRGEKPMMKT